MNPETGHLIANLRLRHVEGYEELPEHLKRAAEQMLAGRQEAQVSLTSGGKLSRWAAKERKRRKRKRKTTAKSRKRNRSK